MRYNNIFIYINDRPVGYIADTTPEELQQHGYTAYEIAFNTASNKTTNSAAAPATPRTLHHTATIKTVVPPPRPC